MTVMNGIDLVEIRRIQKTLDRFPERFFKMVYTPNEIETCSAKGVGRMASLAGRFAAKEAVSKALGTGIGEHASFHEIEVVSDGKGRPAILLHGAAKKTYERIGGRQVALSISHTHEYAIASVVIVTED